MKSLSKWKLFGSLIVVIFVVQLALGLFAIARKERSYRLRPRHVNQVEIRGRTYHIHPESSIDLKHRNTYENRVRLNQALKPHLVARRGILVKNVTGNEEFTDVNGEGSSLNLDCVGSCAIVGMAGTILKSKQGQDIDSASCVFRPGLSPTVGFEEDVGQKTTARIVDAKTISTLLKKPSKITSGHLSVDKWIYYNLHHSKDIAWMLFRLRELKRKFPKMSFLRFSKKGEHVALSSLQENGAKLGYSVIGVTPSSLWYTVRVAEMANCSSIRVYGVPDPKYCKKNLDSPIKLRYWQEFSPPLCTGGNDPGARNLSWNVQDESVLSISDRRGLKGWSTTHNVTFHFPPWP